MFRYALISSDGEALGPVRFARRDFNPGDLIPQGLASPRAVNVVEADEPDELPLLMVESAEPDRL